MGEYGGSIVVSGARLPLGFEGTGARVPRLYVPRYETVV